MMFPSLSEDELLRYMYNSNSNIQNKATKNTEHLPREVRCELTVPVRPPSL